jgi:medium-chain acyl-[acyl-carrier-protein] hydrolase
MSKVPPVGAWVSCARPDPAAPWRLWCLPFAGGGASAWNPWSARLAGIAEIAALRPPGRESRLREAPSTRWRPLVEHLLAEMTPHLGRRYALAGHSLGAMLAFELARLARDRGLPAPAALIVSGARAPGTPRREPDLHALPDAEFIEELDRRYQGIPPGLRSEPELLALLLPVMRADLTIFETYAHAAGAPLALPILAMSGVSDPHVSREEALAWGRQTTGKFEAEFFPGGHFFVQSELGAVTARVARFLAEA